MIKYQIVFYENHKRIVYKESDKMKYLRMDILELIENKKNFFTEKYDYDTLTYKSVWLNGKERKV